MNTYEKKLKFIAMRANGDSLARIAEELGVCTKTCSNWEEKMKKEIEEQRARNVEELSEAYSIQRDARIRRLSNVLERIDNELENKDFSKMPVESLLKMKLRYEAELSKDNVSLSTFPSLKKANADSVKAHIISVINGLSNGTLSESQAKVQLESIRLLFGVTEKTEILPW